MSRWTYTCICLRLRLNSLWIILLCPLLNLFFSAFRLVFMSFLILQDAYWYTPFLWCYFSLYLAYDALCHFDLLQSINTKSTNFLSSVYSIQGLRDITRLNLSIYKNNTFWENHHLIMTVYMIAYSGPPHCYLLKY